MQKHSSKTVITGAVGLALLIACVAPAEELNGNDANLETFKSDFDRILASANAEE